MSSARVISGFLTGLLASGCSDSRTGPGSGGPPPPPSRTIAVVDSAYQPSEVVVSNGALYWLDASPVPLHRIDLTSHASAALFQPVPQPENVVPDGNVLYWVSGGSLYRTSLDGTVTTVVDQGQRDPASGASAEILVDSSAVYWANTISSGSCSPACTFTIRRVPKAGGPATTITSTSQAIAAFAILNGDMYWEEVGVGPASADGTVGSQVKKVALAGGGVTVLVDGLLNGLIPPPGPGWIPASWHPTGGIAVDDSMVYFADASFYTSYRVMKTLSGGGGAAPTILVADTTGDASDFARSLLLYQDHLYWPDLNSIKVIATSGGAFADLASGRTSPFSLVRQGGDFYWIEALCCAHNATGSIERMPVGGGSPVPVRAGIVSPVVVAADQDGVFWVNGGSIGAIEGYAAISRAGLDGTGEDTLVTAATGGLFAVDDSYVYFADEFSIKRVPVHGGPVRLLAIGSFFVRGIATDGAYVYWDEDPVTIVNRVPVAGGPIANVSTGQGPAGVVRVDGSYVYWLDHEDTIRRALKTGGSAELVGAAGTGLLTDFVVSGANVYYAEWDGGRLMKTAVTGGTPSVLAPLNADQTRRLATDGAMVYWVDQSSVNRIPVGGGNADFIASNGGADPFLAGGIAVDEHSVYWAEPFGFVIRMATPK